MWRNIIGSKFYQSQEENLEVCVYQNCKTEVEQKNLERCVSKLWKSYRARELVLNSIKTKKRIWNHIVYQNNKKQIYK